MFRKISAVCGSEFITEHNCSTVKKTNTWLNVWKSLDRYNTMKRPENIQNFGHQDYVCLNVRMKK